MSLIDKPERARQLARAIASDMIVYNDKEIRAGLEKDNLFEVLKELMDEGRALFQRRVAPSVESVVYDRALVDVILKAYASVPCPLW